MAVLLGELAAAFAALSAEVTDGLDASVASAPAPAAVPLDHAAADAILRQAIASLEGGQLDDALMAEVASLLAPHVREGQLHTLAGAIDDFEFARAATVLRQLLEWLRAQAGEEGRATAP